MNDQTTQDPDLGAAAADGPPLVPAGVEEQELVAELRRGDEAAFRRLLAAHDPMLRRLARRLVSTHATADEVVQETWAAVIEALDRFEGRSSLKTWVTRILMNKARTCAGREGRMVPFSSAVREDDLGAAAVDPARFSGRGRWRDPPARWNADTPEELLQREELGALLTGALEELPERQRLVILLRDVEGWTSEEVCSVLGVRETNQRVLLHRARSRLRSLIESNTARC
jgi:RNA polymerase sigma-70 factor, ECF subfamily